MKFKEKVYRVLNESESIGKYGQYISWFIILLILSSVVMVILESVSSINAKAGEFFIIVEYFIVVVFSIEYLARLWSITCNPKYRHPFLGRLRFIISPLAVIDILAIIPFYLPFVFVIDLLFIRAIRIFRIFRLLKITRYSNAIIDSIAVIKSRKEHLILTLTMIVVLLILMSGIMFIVEHSSQPEAFCSIPNTMWWAICTMTTVGYGDIYPITTMGKIIASIISLLGIGIFAVPAGIISSGYIDVLEQKKKMRCPKCGHEFQD